MPTLNTTNFTRDWRDELRSRLQAFGIDPNPLDTRAIEYVYFAAVGRLIDQRPRTVHKAREFGIPHEHRKALSGLRRKIEKGQDLRPHQNRSILSVASPDRLLNDWGIHHLHLGFGKLDADGLAPRTRDVLFVMFHDDEAFMLEIRPHGRGHGELWAEMEFLEIVRRNWPQFLSPMTINGDPSRNPLPKEVLGARTAGVMPMVTLSDGVVYLPIKGGFSTDGTPWHATRSVDVWLRRIWDAEKRVTEGFDRFAANSATAGHSLPVPVELRMHVIDDRIFARVLGTEILWPLEV